MSAVEILIADDHELVRKGLVSIVSRSHPEWTVVAEASNGKDAIERGESLRPTVAILDLSMPDIDGLKVAERLLKSVPGIHILVLTMHSSAPVRPGRRREVARRAAGVLRPSRGHNGLILIRS